MLCTLLRMPPVTSGLSEEARLISTSEKLIGVNSRVDFVPFGKILPYPGFNTR